MSPCLIETIFIYRQEDNKDGDDKTSTGVHVDDAEPTSESSSAPTSLMQQLMLAATQPSPMKAVFSMEELEVFKLSLSFIWYKFIVFCLRLNMIIFNSHLQS